MSLATVYGTSQFGMSDDTTATGLLAGGGSWSATVDQATAPNHIGCDVAASFFNAKKTVTFNGVIAAKGTGIVDTLGSVIVLANTTNNTRTRNSEGTGETPNANASLIVTGNTITISATAFETGDIEMVYFPSIATNAPVTLS